MALPREPLGGEKGRATDGEYTLELAPQRFIQNPVGVLRERPLPRGSVLALHEAVSARGRRTRGGTAKAFRPLSQSRDEGFYFAPFGK